VFALFLAAAAAYVRAVRPGPPRPLELDDAWLVSQLAGDSNPPHGHDGLISGVLYLRVPPQIGGDDDDAGCLHFHPSDPGDVPSAARTSSVARAELVADDLAPAARAADPRVRVRPAPGDLYVFPSWLLHEVSPFVGDGERRSVAFNVRAATEAP
jgi:hypothetical protein